MNSTKLDRRNWMRGVAGGAVALSAAGKLAAAKNDEKIRVAVIGRTGRGNYGHGLDVVWQRIPAAQIVAVADDDSKGLAAAARRLKVDKPFSDYRKMLDEMRPQVVTIAQRWLDMHFEMAMECAERGVHMYMEKPFVRTLDEADKLIAACKKSGAKLALACQSHYSPRVAKAKELIEQGAIGQVLEYRARGKEDRRGGGEDLWVLGTHVLDLIRMLGGDPTSCVATLTENGKPVVKKDVRDGAEGLGPLAGDGVEAVYTMRDGSSAFFASRRNMGDGAGRFGVQIFGSKGMIEVMPNYMGDVSILVDPKWSPIRSKAKWQTISSAGVDLPEPVTKTGNREGNRVAVVDLLSAIRENRDPICGPNEALGTLEMIHAVFESHRLQKRVSMPLDNRRHPLEML